MGPTGAIGWVSRGDGKAGCTLPVSLQRPANSNQSPPRDFGKSKYCAAASSSGSALLSGRATAEQLPVALLSHPSSALKVSVVSPPGAIRFAARVKMQDNARDLTPIGPISVGIKETHVGDQVLVVIRRQDRVRRRGVGNVWIERRSLHRGTGSGGCWAK
jgi:hypothetical protein